MKGFLAILLIVVLHQQVNADDQCHCATYLAAKDDPTKLDLGSQMYSSNDKTVTSCNTAGVKECSHYCTEKISAGTDGGNLSFVRPDKRTVGEIACYALKKDVQNGEIVIASKCGKSGTWEGTKRSKQKLCCISKHYIPCV